MSNKVVVILITAIFLMMAYTGSALAQEQGFLSEAEELPQLQWLWAEVISVDQENNSLTVRYLDYETEQEKEITVTVADRTLYENVNTLDDINPKDTVSIDYKISDSGENVAEYIVVGEPKDSVDVIDIQEEFIVEDSDIREKTAPLNMPSDNYME